MVATWTICLENQKPNIHKGLSNIKLPDRPWQNGITFLPRFFCQVPRHTSGIARFAKQAMDCVRSRYTIHQKSKYTSIWNLFKKIIMKLEVKFCGGILYVHNDSLNSIETNNYQIRGRKQPSQSWFGLMTLLGVSNKSGFEPTLTFHFQYQTTRFGLNFSNNCLAFYDSGTQPCLWKAVLRVLYNYLFQISFKFKIEFLFRVFRAQIHFQVYTIVMTIYYSQVKVATAFI